MVVNAIKLFAGLVQGAGMVVNKIVHLFTEMVRAVLGNLSFFGWIIEKLGGGKILDGIDAVGDFIEGVGEGAADGIRAAADLVGVGLDTLIGVAENIDTSNFAEIGESLSASIVDGLAGKREEFGAFVDGIRDDLQEGLKQFEPTPIGERVGEGIAEGAEGALEEKSDEIFVPTVESSNEAGSQAGENFANKFMDALKSIEQKFVDLVGDYFKSEIDTVVGELTDALEAQRDAALAVFDEQLSALDALEKAEKSLMKEREFLLERKRILDARELQRENYKRNRALAIYEGRIDDARMMQREDEKNQMDSASSLGQLEEKRKQDLRKENLEFMRDQIKETKKAADAFFKEQIAAFKESSKEITKFAPQTIEDYESQLNQLKDKATEFSDANAEEFAKTFTAMNETILNDMPNKTVTPFGFQLDELVAVAQSKFGLTDNSTGVLGATLSMLQQIESNVVGNVGINDAFTSLTGGLDSAAVASSELIQTAVSGTLTGWEGLLSGNTGIQSNFDSIVDGIVESIKDTGDDGIAATIENHGPQAVLEAAIINAETTILNEWKGTVGHILSEVDPLANMMDPMIANILEAQLAMEALEEAARSAGSAAADAGSAGGDGVGDGGGFKPKGTISLAQYQSIAASGDSLMGSVFGIRQLERLSSAEYKQYKDKIVGAISEVLQFVAGGNSVQASYDIVKKQTNNSKAIAGLKEYMRRNYPNVSLAYGGSVPGFRSAGVPAMLHGGEYVINSKAVSNIGMAALQAMNNMRFATPGRFGGGQNVTTINKSETVNIYVENFIGEDEWFNSMVEKYDMKVRPMNDRKYNTQDRFYTTYKGASY
jgi:hypothetical protein